MTQQTNLKNLASIAKQRLKNKDYSATTQNTTNNANSYFLKNIQTLKKLTGNTEFITITNDEDAEFIEKVQNLINSGEDLNPISKLVDNKVYKTLSEIEKQAYVLKLSERYINVKNNYLNKKSS